MQQSYVWGAIRVYFAWLEVMGGVMIGKTQEGSFMAKTSGLCSPEIIHLGASKPQNLRQHTSSLGRRTEHEAQELFTAASDQRVPANPWIWSLFMILTIFIIVSKIIYIFYFMTSFSLPLELILLFNSKFSLIF